MGTCVSSCSIKLICIMLDLVYTCLKTFSVYISLDIKWSELNKIE